MVRIRLRRTGAKNNPTFRIIVADQRAPRDGAFIDTLGHYLPTRNPHVVEIDAVKAREWLLKGAQPSDTAASLLKQKGILTRDGKIAELGATPEIFVQPKIIAAPTPFTETVTVTEAPIETSVSETVNAAETVSSTEENLADEPASA